MEILYEDQFIVAINKMAKQFVHPMPGEKDSKHCSLFEVRDYLGQHVYPINRLDRPVSGVLLFGKNPDVVTRYQQVWHAEKTRKQYACLHRGILKHAGVFDSALSKKSAFSKSKNKKPIKQAAFTLFTPEVVFPSYFCTYTQVEIKTGRYHQIRRHFRKAIMPIVGDRVHGKGKVNHFFKDEFGLDRIFLHCLKLRIQNPFEANQMLEISAELPNDLTRTLGTLKASDKDYESLSLTPIDFQMPKDL